MILYDRGPVPETDIREANVAKRDRLEVVLELTDDVHESLYKKKNKFFMKMGK